ncbi:hypothetical protein BDV95DRAFT_558806 [Massariosphaeria phaeospora]|uniref:Uncharacterized protein n=1 Tax=Massariosphaeria phaeospora TaxID=100035 RepID=A0A7C8MJQ4_9PLEO|nr:hypothetical protein BDV95DRAFT_558806 [Massariosphaeria phaeospora]
MTWLATGFFGTADKNGVAQALYLKPNISQGIADIAISMTNRIREGRNSTLVEGIEYREETFIRVSWAWLVLPGMVVLMSIVLLVATMMLCRKRGEGLWKNSVIATMFAQMRGWERLKSGKLSEMGDQAKGMEGRLEKNEEGELDFVRT